MTAPTLAGLADDWIDGRRDRGDLSANSAAVESYRLRALERVFGDRAVIDLDAGMVEALEASLGHLTPKSRQDYLGTVARFTRWLRTEGHLDVDPCGRGRGDGEAAGSDLDLLVRFEDETMVDLSPLTVQSRQGAVLRFARWLAPKSLLEATTGDISTWLDGLGLAAGTRRDRTAALHHFYNWLLNEQLVDRDPAAPLIKMRAPITAGELPGLLRGHLVAQERRGLARSSIEKRARMVRQLFDWLAPKSVCDATTDDIERFLDSIRSRSGGRKSSKTTYNYISNLHAFYRWARREGLVTEDPTENIDRPRLSQNVPRPMSDADLIAALELADPPMRVMLCLGAFGGLRAKEIAGITREDILDHLDPPIIIVSAPKGRRQRALPLHPETWKAMQALPLPRGGPLFTWPDGRTFHPWKVSSVINTYLHGLGIAATCHQMRHAFATKVYGASLDIRLTQELMGHSSPTTTAVYVQFNRTAAHDVVNGLMLDPGPVDL